ARTSTLSLHDALPISYRTAYEEVRGNYKEVAVGIKPVLNKINKFVIGSYKPSWDSGESSSVERVVNISLDAAPTTNADKLRHIPDRNSTRLNSSHVKI